MSFKDLEGQLVRWLERLQQYDFEVSKGYIERVEFMETRMDYQDGSVKQTTVAIAPRWRKNTLVKKNALLEWSWKL